MQPLPAHELVAYQRDGVVCLRGRFDAGWVEMLRRGVDRNAREPGPNAIQHGHEREGAFWEDAASWPRIPEYRRFVEASPCARIAAALMDSPMAQLFHEHVLVKEPGCTLPTVWHRDADYFCVEAPRSVSVWLALDPVDAACCPRFWPGSHVSGPEGRAQAFSAASPRDDLGHDAPVPHEPTLAWALEPGDAIAFHFQTWHGAPPNPGHRRRRAFVTRWMGEGARYVDRGHACSPRLPDVVVRPGAAPDPRHFPVLWRARG